MKCKANSNPQSLVVAWNGGVRAAASLELLWLLLRYSKQGAAPDLRQLHFRKYSSLHDVSIMGADDTSNPQPQPPGAMINSTTPTDRLVNFTSSSAQAQPDLQPFQHHNDSTADWSAIQHDFERRLNRFGIKLSEADNDPASKNPRRPVSLVPAFTGPRSITKEDIPLRRNPTMACFTNSRKESKLESTEWQLRQARTEARIWKEKSEARDNDLRTSHKETMEWRMKYEDLYSAMIQNSEPRPHDLTEKREVTKSLG
ncbi:hypothetical protein ST47_g1730 [Ascochyta rabiei]|uniref:Uncharacterized protein n=1 Tax=Didymella rabiei TaxID=5454 RepID=A0A163KNL7_DIDRA|nr:hypothetical protein ST47_g1730 [Ascochyta rabiei]